MKDRYLLVSDRRNLQRPPIYALFQSIARVPIEAYGNVHGQLCALSKKLEQVFLPMNFHLERRNANFLSNGRSRVVKLFFEPNKLAYFLWHIIDKLTFLRSLGIKFSIKFSFYSLTFWLYFSLLRNRNDQRWIIGWRNVKYEKYYIVEFFRIFTEMEGLANINIRNSRVRYVSRMFDSVTIDRRWNYKTFRSTSRCSIVTKEFCKLSTCTACKRRTEGSIKGDAWMAFTTMKFTTIYRHSRAAFICTA